MKLLSYMKDGGPESKVSGYWLVEIKSLFSVVLLHFYNGSREAYHNHAFDALSVVLKGELEENLLHGKVNTYTPGKVIYTARSVFHRVVSKGDTWVLSVRGPWSKTWKEFLPGLNKFVTLTNGRKILEEK